MSKEVGSPLLTLGNAGSLDPLFNPKSVAILGASGIPGTTGYAALSTVMGGEFRGPMFIVSSNESSLLGRATIPHLRELPNKVDLAVVVCSPAEAPAILTECVTLDIRGVVLLSGGFGEPDLSPAQANQQMAAILQGSKTRVIGPGGLGIINPLIGLNATAGLPMPIGGTVAFVGESATLGHSVLEWSLRHLVGFSAFASLGAMLDVSWANLIDYFGRDPFTRTIVLQVSSIGDARSFISAAREVSLDKPIIVIKAGRSEQAVRAFPWNSHCVPSDDAVLTAAFHRVGVLQVDTLEDLFYTADALSKQPRPQGRRLMVVSNTDAGGVLAADSVVEAGVELAEPSVETREALRAMLPPRIRGGDVLGDGSTESYLKAVELAAQDPNCDGLLLLLVPWALSDPQGTAETLLATKDSHGKPMLISYLGSSEIQQNLVRACIPMFPSPAVAARVFQYMWKYSYDLQGVYETPMLRAGNDAPQLQSSVQSLIDAARNHGRVSLTPSESGKILSNYGIATLGHGVPRVATRLVTGRSWVRASTRSSARF